MRRIATGCSADSYQLYSLFRWSKRAIAELVPEHLNQLWWYPPQPAVAVNSIPGEVFCSAPVSLDAMKAVESDTVLP